MITLDKNIINFFREILNDLECHSDTQAYITSIYVKYKSTEFDLSKDSVTLLFAQARDKQDFLTYQNLGDWIFFTKTLAPNHLKYASKEYYKIIAQLSYYSCYKLVNKKWHLFEELSDNFDKLTYQVSLKLQNISLII